MVLYILPNKLASNWAILTIYTKYYILKYFLESFQARKVSENIPAVRINDWMSFSLSQINYFSGYIKWKILIGFLKAAELNPPWQILNSMPCSSRQSAKWKTPQNISKFSLSSLQWIHKGPVLKQLMKYEVMHIGNLNKPNQIAIFPIYNICSLSVDLFLGFGQKWISCYPMVQISSTASWSRSLW